MYVMFIIGAQWKGILERTKVSKGFLGKSAKGWQQKKRKNISAGKLALKKKHRIIGMQNNRFGIYTDCNGEIRRGHIMEGFLCYIKHPELLFCFFVLTDSTEVG